MKQIEPLENKTFDSEKILRKNHSLESIPGCFGFYEFPLAPNRCETCKAAWLCKMAIPKTFREYLKEIDFKVVAQ